MLQERKNTLLLKKNPKLSQTDIYKKPIYNQQYCYWCQKMDASTVHLLAGLWHTGFRATLESEVLSCSLKKEQGHKEQ